MVKRLLRHKGNMRPAHNHYGFTTLFQGICEPIGFVDCAGKRAYPHYSIPPQLLHVHCGNSLEPQVTFKTGLLKDRSDSRQPDPWEVGLAIYVRKGRTSPDQTHP